MTEMTNPLRAPLTAADLPLNIAHRGARAFAPENTLPAFEKAKRFGCPMFELDVHLSQDRQLVVHHDDDLTRCTDVREKFPGRNAYFVSDFSYDQLLRLDAGSWYAREITKPSAQRQAFLQTLTEEEIRRFVSLQDRDHYLSGAVKLPLLRQVLEFAQTSSMMVNIELKTLPRMYPGLAQAVVALVKEMDLEPCVLISSFDHEQLVEVRRLSNIIATGVLSSDRLAKPGDYLRLLDADAYNPGCYGDYDSLGFGSVNQEFDARGIVHTLASGRGVNVWTCNEKEHISQLFDTGITGIITDFPNRVLDITEASTYVRQEIVDKATPLQPDK